MTEHEELPQRDLFGARPGEYMLPKVPLMPARCQSCKAAIVFIRTRSGAMMPLSLSTVEERDGDQYAMPHWIDCPDSKEWSGKP